MKNFKNFNSAIRLRGVRENCLNNINIDFPIGAMMVVCGPSGSGKTSLIINTLFAESQRRFIETIGTRRRGKFSLWKRPDLDSIENLPPAATVSDKVDLDQTLAQLCGMDDALALAFSRYAVPICPFCDIEVIPGGAASAAEYFELSYAGCRAQIAFIPPATGVSIYESLFEKALDYRIRGFNRWLIERDSNVEMIETKDLMNHPNPSSQLETFYVLVDRLAFKPGESRTKESFEQAFAESGGKAVVFIEMPEGTVKRYAGLRRTCPQCGRIFADCSAERFYLSEMPEDVSERDKVLAYRLNGKNLLEWSELSADQMVELLRDSSLDSLLKISQALQDVGLGYMSLSRKAKTMSGGQIRRAEMASMLAGDLVNMLYVFDEPMDGVPPENRPALISALQRLRDRGNTIVIADNDDSLIQAADFYTDLKDADKRMRSMSNEKLDNILKTVASTPHTVLSASESITISPGKITAITGRAGSGKSVLLSQLAGKSVLSDWKRTITGLEEFEDTILVERKLERKPPRGCVATYIGIWDSVREELASTPEARARGFTPGDFSLMSGKGRCPQCKGEGVVTINLEYLPEIEMVCSECLGNRFQKAILQPRFRGLNAAEILQLTVDEAFMFFQYRRNVQLSLKSLMDIGLGRLKLGQPVKTLSAGERSRLDLAEALRKIYKQKTLFLLDEPSAGLHACELFNLIDIFHRLVSYGHTVVMIENNPRMIRLCNIELHLE